MAAGKKEEKIPHKQRLYADRHIKTHAGLNRTLSHRVSTKVKKIVTSKQLLRPAAKLGFQGSLVPKALCLPLDTGTGSRDIRFPFPLAMAKTLLGLVMVRFDNGLEFGSVPW